MATTKAYGEGQNFTPATPKPLNLLSPKFAQVITSVYLLPCKILSKSDQEFRFRACTTPHTKLFTWLLFWGSSSHLQPRCHHGHRRKIRQKTRFRTRMCLFRSQNQNLTFTLLFLQNRQFQARFCTQKFSAEKELQHWRC